METMDFKELLTRCQSGDHAALEELFLMYRPLIVKKSYLNKEFDQDLFQQNSETLLHFRPRSAPISANLLSSMAR